MSLAPQVSSLAYLSCRNMVSAPPVRLDWLSFSNLIRRFRSSRYDRPPYRPGHPLAIFSQGLALHMSSAFHSTPIPDPQYHFVIKRFKVYGDVFAGFVAAFLFSPHLGLFPHLLAQMSDVSEMSVTYSTRQAQIRFAVRGSWTRE